LTVTEKASRPRDPSGNAFFDDSFFDNFFGNTVQKQVTLTSEADTVNIHALPSANRPADFSGALGQFTVTAEASPDHVSAGDPITLRLTVTGRGYFDPETATYVTRNTTPIFVDVAQVANPTAVAAAAAAPTGNADRTDFYPDRVEAGSFVSTLQPLFLRPWFIILNVLVWGALAAVFCSLRRRARLTADPRLARARQADRAIHDQLIEMDSAIQHAQTPAFFAAARRALQQRLGERWDLPPETITLTEINSRLNGHADGIRPVFQMADQVAYSHANLPAGDLAGWKRILNEQLKELETL
jgi:hypothetical protein